MTYDVNYFIQKFEAIPEKNWVTHNHRIGRSQNRNQNKYCAQGHCLADWVIDKIDNTPFYKPTEQEKKLELFEAMCLCQLFAKVGGSGIVIGINNGEDDRYPQPTPKQRILAALNDILKQQTDSAVDEAKEIIANEQLQSV